MSDKSFRIRLWGTRGSLPVSGRQFRAFGGNTICVEMQCGPHRLLFDAGSGLREAGDALLAEGVADIDIFFSHFHYDHVIGLPYFVPLYKSRAAVTLWSGHMGPKMTTREMVRQLMRPPWFPVEPDICSARVETRDFHPGDVLHPRPGITIRTANLVHPGGAVGYRVEWGGRSVVMVTDTEHTPDIFDPVVLKLIDGCDLFLYDCTYLDSEMERYRGYGHSSWQQAVRLANEAGVGKLFLYHHDPEHDDDEMDRIAEAAARMRPGTMVAREGLAIDL